MILGCRVAKGVAKIGTPLCVPLKHGLEVGRIVSMEKDKVERKEAKRGEELAIKIQQAQGQAPRVEFGRHFDHTQPMVSKLTRASIDVLKANYRDEMSDELWRLCAELKRVLSIV